MIEAGKPIRGNWRLTVEVLQAALNDPQMCERLKKAADWYESLKILHDFDRGRKR
jgi:hypothetical protein